MGNDLLPTVATGLALGLALVLFSRLKRSSTAIETIFSCNNIEKTIGNNEFKHTTSNECFPDRDGSQHSAPFAKELQPDSRAWELLNKIGVSDSVIQDAIDDHDYSSQDRQWTLFYVVDKVLYFIMILGLIYVIDLMSRGDLFKFAASMLSKELQVLGIEQHVQQFLARRRF